MTPELCSKNSGAIPKMGNHLLRAGPFRSADISAILLNPIAISDIRKLRISLEEIQMSLQEIRKLATMFLQEHL